MATKSKRRARRPRDNNVKMLYHLENNGLYRGAQFSSKEQVQSYVDFITATTYWKSLPKVPEAVIVFSYGDNSYSQQRFPNEIWLADVHRCQQVVLHELAHFVADNHGPKFIRAYLDLITQFMGTEICRQYAKAFELGGIRE